MELIIPILLFLLLIILVLYKAKIKGIVGEKTISSVLYFLDGSKYKVLNNVVLKNGGLTSQIDHLVVSDFGIFVIETKNYKGWIVGSEKSEYWTQVIFRHKSKFYNPLLQNSGHIKALKNCLNDFPYINYHSIVVFSSSADIKVNTSKDVVNSNRLLKTIKKYDYVNLTETEKNNIVQRLKSSNVVDSYDKREHVQAIKERVHDREKAKAGNKCPRCGSGLSKRKGKFGDFWGCSSYPRCTFTKNI